MSAAIPVECGRCGLLRRDATPARARRTMIRHLRHGHGIDKAIAQDVVRLRMPPRSPPRTTARAR